MFCFLTIRHLECPAHENDCCVAAQKMTMVRPSFHFNPRLSHLPCLQPCVRWLSTTDVQEGKKARSIQVDNDGGESRNNLTAQQDVLKWFVCGKLSVRSRTSHCPVVVRVSFCTALHVHLIIHLTRRTPRLPRPTRHNDRTAVSEEELVVLVQRSVVESLKHTHTEKYKSRACVTLELFDCRKRRS